MSDMRRGTPAAELFGAFLELIRRAGPGASMRQIGDRIGAPAATVSQIEKGQRALKSDRVGLWAHALAVNEDDLRELWWMSQGMVLVGNRRTFYAHAGARELLESQELGDSVTSRFDKSPELEPMYRLAGLMAVVVKRLLPRAVVQVEQPDYEPLYIDKEAAGLELTAQEQDEQADHWAALVWQPWLECYWDDRPGEPESWESTAYHRVAVPVLHEATPIIRKRAKAVATVELEGLIRDLSGPERERVRGYVEAVIEQRDEAPD
jgi:transcriptional regulator with XRE-family HTH domain